MKLKVQVDDQGVGYVALIDPATNEHKKATSVSRGQEVVLTMPGVTDASEVEFSDVAVIESPPQTGEPAPAEGNGQEGGAPEGGGEQPAVAGEKAPDTPADGGEGGQAPAGGSQGGQGGGTGTETPTTSAASEKPLYLVEGDPPPGYVLSGLETPDGKSLYHYESDTAGQSATGNVDGVSVYADYDDDEKPVQAAAPVEGA